MLEIGLIGIILLVLILPLTVHLIEKNLELFLFVMGISAVTLAHFWGPDTVWSLHLLRESLVEPIMITAVVFIVGLLVHFFRKEITGSIIRLRHLVGLKWFCFVVITVLGLLSSFITAIMAAIILVEIIGALNLDKKHATTLVILGCFSIGLGAALTPVGEPLSTICIAKLRGEPYQADFFFLFRLLGWYIIPGVVALGIFGAFMEPHLKERPPDQKLMEEQTPGIKDVFLYAGKVYVFIMALIYLGTGFKPIIDTYIIKLPSPALYWINTVSAILDNATLTAAEISPKMALLQIKYVLMGLLIAGGMLIPGNIPNIIAASRLKIKSKEWARLGVPLGFVLMVIYFIIFSLH